MAGMPVARAARLSDLPSVLDLFGASDVSPPAEPMERAIAIWDETLTQPGTAVFVSEQQGRVVATCMLVTAPNLLRGGKRHAFLENVVTHPDYRGMGHGSAVVSAALDRAWDRDCHHVLLQSGRRNARVHDFYEKLGFQPGLRTAYVCGRPDS